MKKTILSAVLPALLLSGCVGFHDNDFYADRNNWVIRDERKTDAGYDVFYIYTTLAGKAESPEMEWKNDPKLQQKITGFANAQIGS